MSTTGRLSAALTLRRGAARVGLERVELLEAIGELGSITAAAKRLGLSYKGAWDGVQALNNLFDGPLVQTAAGGRTGGAAGLTPRGAAVIAGFRKVAGEIEASVGRLESHLAEGQMTDLFWTLGLRTSARNALRGEVVALECETVSGKVQLRLAQDVEIAAHITRRSIEDLGLVVGQPAIALIKANFITLTRQAPPVSEGLNLLPGLLVEREDGSELSEMLVDIGGGKSLVATMPLAAASLLQAGENVIARIEMTHVILAVE
ncbi:MAG: molybdenum-dependent transcriptional regulator [Caulobacteraceae bacterium]|nr:molybdenum-dependent transcriptional regulator [Caulobacteraceae bacterium]